MLCTYTNTTEASSTYETSAPEPLKGRNSILMQDGEDSQNATEKGRKTPPTRLY